MMNFQSPDADMTLVEGLREYYGSREELYDGRGPSESANTFFRCHDVAHVVFGCSTDLHQEGVLKLWSFFGTTAGLSLMRSYRSPEAKEIYETIGWMDIPRTAIALLRLSPRVLYRCTQMTQRWPWDAYEPYLNVSVARIREEFGIRVLVRG